jgi:glycosyltransferase involved in cell wall biosynthesis
MRPIQVTALIDTFQVGGPGKQLMAFCKAAPACGMTVRIATFLRRKHRTSPFIDACRAEGLDPHVFDERFLFDARLLALVRTYLRSNDVQVLQTHSYKANVIASLLSATVKRSGGRWIGYVHGFTNENASVRLYYALELRALRRADAVITVSEPLRRRVVRAVGQSRVQVVWNASLPERLPSTASPSSRAVARRGLGIPEGAVVASVIGRLSSEKGQGVFLEALAELGKANVVGLIVGEGPDEEALRIKAGRLGLSGTVRFAGYRPDIAPIYAATDILVIPSFSEGIPNVALEAMGQQIPLVATAVGGIPEMIGDRESGLLVAPGDATALAESIRRLTDHPDERARLAARAKEIVETRFSLAGRMRRIQALYCDILARQESHD